MRHQLLLSLIISLLLTACGFQLRGSNQSLSEKFQHTYVADHLSEDGLFLRQIKQLIALNGGQIVDKAAAQVALSLTPITTSSRQIAIAGSGTLKEYERTYEVTVTLVDMSNQVQLGSRTLSVVRNIQLDDSNVLAGEERSETTYRVAERALAQSVLRYLESF